MFSAARERAGWKEMWNDMGCQLVLVGPVGIVAVRYSSSA
jgi:hypothetical protein